MSESVDYEFIDDLHRLKEICDLIGSLSEDDYIGLDTEFMRRNSFYPYFSLMQLAIHGHNYLIDMSKLGENNKAILEAIGHTDAIILTFGCSEDVVLLAHEARRLECTSLMPRRMYDIQVLLSFAGHSYGRGLNYSVQQFLGVTLSKDCTLSNWYKRPLSSKQLKYAALDVHYLEELFVKIRQITTDTNYEYFKEEMEYMRQCAIEEPSDDEAYLSIPGAGLLNEKELNVLYHLAKERQIRAREDNVSLNHVITTKAMWQLARFLPRSKRELSGRGVQPRPLHVYGNEILAWLNRARKQRKYEGLVIPYDYFCHHRCMQGNFDCLKAAMKEQIKKSGICPQLLTKKPLLNDYFRAKALGQTPLIQQSWRLAVLGKIDVPLEPMSSIENDVEEFDENMPSSRYVSDYMKLNDIDENESLEIALEG